MHRNASIGDADTGGRWNAANITVALTSGLLVLIFAAMFLFITGQ
jgi:hypothetical protein